MQRGKARGLVLHLPASHQNSSYYRCRFLRVLAKCPQLSFKAERLNSAPAAPAGEGGAVSQPQQPVWPGHRQAALEKVLPHLLGAGGNSYGSGAPLSFSLSSPGSLAYAPFCKSTFPICVLGNDVIRKAQHRTSLM